MAEFPTVFDDAPFRSMTGPPMHIDLRDDAVPCRHYRARTIPFQWRAAVKAQLASMVTKGVIEKVPVGESFTWCHPMVVVLKKSSTEPRITVDLTGLNKYVQRPAYPTECQARSSPASHQACGILPRWTRGTATGRFPWTKKARS